MGCINSKRAAAASSAVLDYTTSTRPPLAIIDRSSVLSSKDTSGSLEFELNSNNNNNNNNKRGSRNNSRRQKKGEGDGEEEEEKGVGDKKLKKGGSRGGSNISFKIGHRNVGVEQVAAGWPSWLSSAAGEAIQGWVPLRADAYEKLEKVGQGTYSSVFRAREIVSGRMVALKKVCFDNFKAESIRFMAREIMILRSLDHPNIMKLDGIIASRLSSSIYLVFEYMEHDLAGLLSSPDVDFSESQIKCYMKQLLLGIEHCHLRGIMHRDIKASNILVNNQGILKIGDFGLANILNSRNRQQLTSRVVTLWYRPPELLMGSTSYGMSVDLWSVGCVFAQLLTGKPLLKGRTEVEQLHKIFRLCGSPPEDYWKQTRLPNATMFRPQHPYESSLRERFKDFSTTAVDLIEMFLSVEPEKRGSASDALTSEYFNTVPHACDPSSLPKYPPNKEMDAKYREDARRKKAGGITQDSEAPGRHRKSHRMLQEHNSLINFIQQEMQESKDNLELVRKANDTATGGYLNKGRGGMHQKLSSPFDSILQTSQIIKGDCVFKGPAPISSSSGFAWAKKQKGDVPLSLSCNQSISTSQTSSALDSSRLNIPNGSFDLVKDENERHDNPNEGITYYSCHSTTAEDQAFAQANHMTRAQNNQSEKIELPGPLLLSQSNSIDHWNKIDELMLRNENNIRLAARRTTLDQEI